MNPQEKWKKWAKRKPRGYWTEAAILRELKELSARLGYFPGNLEIRQVSPALADHVSHSGGGNKYCRLLGCKKRSRKYWTEEVVVRELKSLAARLGHFPSHAEMVRVSGTLSVRVVNFGGIDKFRRLSGYEKVPSERGYWTEEAVIRELKPLIAKLGRFPGRPDLARVGKENLVCHIHKYGGGHKMAARLGCPTKRRPPGYWTKEIVMGELKEICAKLGHFPSHLDLLSLKRSALSLHIPRFGGAYKLAMFFGCKPVKKPKGYWTEETIAEDLKPLTDELGRFPTRRELRRAGKADLIRLITKLNAWGKLRGTR